MADLTDLEITRLCAQAMGIALREVSHNEPQHTLRIVGTFGTSYGAYWPLLDDAQVMALVKRLKLQVIPSLTYGLDGWWVTDGHNKYRNDNLNRAICLCVASMEQERSNGK